MWNTLFCMLSVFSNSFFPSCLPESNRKKKKSRVFFPKSLDKNSRLDFFSPSWVTYPSQESITEVTVLPGHLFFLGARVSSIQGGLSVRQQWFCSGAVARSRSWMPLADDKCSLYLPITKPCAGDWYKHKHDLISFPFPPIHLLKSKF